MTVGPDDELDRRLSLARERVGAQRQDLQRSRRQLREAHAAASALTDAAIAIRLRSQGLLAEPPIPSYPPVN